MSDGAAAEVRTAERSDPATCAIPARPLAPVEIAAGLFGMSAADLMAALRGGESVDDIALRLGVPIADLNAALDPGGPSAD